MTRKEYAEEYAKELVLKFMNLQEPNYNWFNKELAKKCALIAVKEMLENDGWSSSQYEWDVFKKYFIEVIEEIENL
jgi:hypothetical protein